MFTFDKSVVLCGAPALDLAHGNAPVQQVGPVREHTPPCGGPVTCGEREVCTPILERRALTLVGVVVVVVAAARGVCVPVLHLTKRLGHRHGVLATKGKYVDKYCVTVTNNS